LRKKNSSLHAQDGGPDPNYLYSKIASTLLMPQNALPIQ